IGAAIELRIENGQSLASALCRLLDGGDVALLCRGANDAEKDRRDNVCVKRRIGPLHPLVGKGALALVGGAQAAAAVCGDEIAHDHVALPQHEPVILQHRNETARVELAELRRVEAAKWAANVDALVRQLELCHRPHHLLNVERRLASPHLQHIAPPPSSGRALCRQRLSIPPNANAPAGETRWRALTTLPAGVPRQGGGSGNREPIEKFSGPYGDSPTLSNTERS